MLLSDRNTFAETDGQTSLDGLLRGLIRSGKRNQKVWVSYNFFQSFCLSLGWRCKSGPAKRQSVLPISEKSSRFLAIAMLYRHWCDPPLDRQGINFSKLIFRGVYSCECSFYPLRQSTSQFIFDHLHPVRTGFTDAAGHLLPRDVLHKSPGIFVPSA